MWPPDADDLLTRRAAAIEQRHHPAVVLEGSGTFVADDAGSLQLPDDNVPAGVLRTDFLPCRSPRWFAVVDTRGRVAWTHKGDEETSLLVIASHSTPLPYLGHLRQKRIPYLLAGARRADLTSALEKLRTQLGVTCLVSQAGGGRNGARGVPVPPAHADVRSVGRGIRGRLRDRAPGGPDRSRPGREHPLLAEAAVAVLGPDWHLDGLELRAPLPGCGHQGLHPDYFPGHRTRGRWRSLSAMWCISAFTPDNGPLRVIPGSRRVDQNPADALSLGCEMGRASGRSKDRRARRIAHLVQQRRPVAFQHVQLQSGPAPGGNRRSSPRPRTGGSGARRTPASWRATAAKSSTWAMAANEAPGPRKGPIGPPPSRCPRAGWRMRRRTDPPCDSEHQGCVGSPEEPAGRLQRRSGHHRS